MAKADRVPGVRAPLPQRQPVKVRLRDWHEVYEPFPEDETRRPGCALHGLRHPVLPRGLPAREPHPRVERPRLPRRLARRRRAPSRHQQLPRVHRTALPGALRGSCVLGINADPVTIERIEYEIAERAWSEGWVDPGLLRSARASRWRSSARVRRACWCPTARRAGHEVVVSSVPRSRAACSATGSPSSRWRRSVLERRLSQLAPRGWSSVVEVRSGLGDLDEHRPADRRLGLEIAPRRPLGRPGGRAWSSPGCARARGGGRRRRRGGLGQTSSSPRQRRRGPRRAGRRCRGSSRSRQRAFDGIHLAIDYLKPSNLVREGRLEASPISAAGKRVVIIGGGDTGRTASARCTDRVPRACTSSRSCPARPTERPWTTLGRVAAGLQGVLCHEEGGDRLYSVDDDRFVGEDRGT